MSVILLPLSPHSGVSKPLLWGPHLVTESAPFLYVSQSSTLSSAPSWGHDLILSSLSPLEVVSLQSPFCREAWIQGGWGTRFLYRVGPWSSVAAYGAVLAPGLFVHQGRSPPCTAVVCGKGFGVMSVNSRVALCGFQFRLCFLVAA